MRLSTSGKDLDSKVWLILVNFSFRHMSSHLPLFHNPTADNCACVPGAVCTHVAGARVGKIDPVIQILRLYILISDSEQRDAKRRQPLLLYLPSLMQVPPR